MSAHPAAEVSLEDGAAVLAFDVGGTDIKAAVVDESGAVSPVLRVPTPEAGPGSGDRVIAEVTRLATRLREGRPDLDVVATGLVVPGIVDDVTGVGIFSENLGWSDYPFRDAAATRLRMPIGFGHDVRAAGTAERVLGAARGFDNVLVVTIGTGIAAAVFVDGRPYTAGGLAGEIGHDRVADGPACLCGGRGCLEAIASAAAIVRAYNLRSRSEVRGAREVLERAETGDADAREVWERALDALALEFSHVVALFAPDAIVVGGGLSGAGDALLEPVRARLDDILSFHRRPQLLTARVGGDAGLYGAALYGRAAADAERASF